MGDRWFWGATIFAGLIYAAMAAQSYGAESAYAVVGIGAGALAVFVGLMVFGHLRGAGQRGRGHDNSST